MLVQPRDRRAKRSLSACQRDHCWGAGSEGGFSPSEHASLEHARQRPEGPQDRAWQRQMHKEQQRQQHSSINSRQQRGVAAKTANKQAGAKGEKIKAKLSAQSADMIQK